MNASDFRDVGYEIRDGQAVRIKPAAPIADLSTIPVKPILKSWTNVHGTMSYAFSLPGAPRTKKTSNQGVRMGAKCPACNLGRGQVRVFPSKQFRDYQSIVTDYVATKPELHLHLEAPVGVAAIFYRDRNSGDLMGYLQGLCDLLQHCGIILNDRQVANVNGSRLDKDADNPRVELTLTVLPHVVQEEIAL